MSIGVDERRLAGFEIEFGCSEISVNTKGLLHNWKQALGFTNNPPYRTNNMRFTAWNSPAWRR